VTTEITDYSGNRLPLGWILYDGDCPLCIHLAQHYGPALRRRHWELLPLQTPWVQERLGLSREALLNEMRVLMPDGQSFGGAEAVVRIARRFWWGWPLWMISQLPGTTAMLKVIYAQVAAHRHLLKVTCDTKCSGRERQRRRCRVFMEFP
jgi:predicted DCC family thiol-disulfide oxidoreductase YuxK